MQDQIKRYFWIVPVVAVMLCAFYAAKATAHIVEAKVLGDSKTAPPARATVLAAAEPRVVRHSKDGVQLTQRNMFCSGCTPAVAVVTDPSQVPMTSLSLLLVATNVSQDPTLSFASVVNADTQVQGGYHVGDKLPGAGPIKEIHYKYIDFENSGRIERLVLAGLTEPVIAAAPEPPPAVAAIGDSKDELQAALDSGIRKLSDTSFEVDRALVDKALANPMAIAKGARIVPSVKDGKPDGFKLYAIRQNSVYSKLGLSNGDTLQSINGYGLTSAEAALEVYTKLREATALEVSVSRRGKPVTLKYSIR
ncbi:MAG: type II secretion system protein GspC [Kofleriaceae bacterium]